MLKYGKKVQLCTFAMGEIALKATNAVMQK